MADQAQDKQPPRDRVRWIALASCSIGLASLVTGIALLSVPAAFIIGGVLVAGVGAALAVWG